MNNVDFLNKQGSKELEERSPEKEKRKTKLRGDERKERKMNRKRVSSPVTVVDLVCLCKLFSIILCMCITHHLAILFFVNVYSF